MSTTVGRAGGDRFEARDRSTMFNAPDGTINVYQDGHGPRPMHRLWMAPPHAAGMVARPELAEPLLELVTAEAGEQVAVSGVHGTGGFGKTTLAAWICHQPQVRDRFSGGLLWVTVGEHAAGAELAGRINNLIEHLTGARSGFTDPIQAGHRLGALLDNQPDPVLLVVDDVWRVDQLDPFCQGGIRCRRLVTTRHRGLVPARSSVWVDQMSTRQAAALLTRDLADPPTDLVARILTATGRWPVLLSIANRTVVRHVENYGATAAWALRDIADRLAEEGPTSFDFEDPARSGRAIDATVRAGLDLLDPAISDRFTELAIFGEDVDIPLSVLTLLWAKTGGLTPRGTRRVCAILAGMSLLLQYQSEAGTIRLHDIIRSYLIRNATDNSQRTRLHALLLDAAVALTMPAASATTSAASPTVAWWTLPAAEEYLAAHLAEHLHGADRHDDLAATVTDLRWITTRLQRHGPAAIEADLAYVTTATATTLAKTIRQNSHLLTPTDPPDALGDVLVSRLDNEPDLAPLVAAYAPALPLPRLANRWPPPDVAHPALLRTLTGHTGSLSVLVSPLDGAWVASGGHDGTVRVWDPTTGALRSVFTDHSGPVSALVSAPDGAWVASGGHDGTVRVWDPTTGALRSVFTDHSGRVEALVAAPDGSWVASGGPDGSVRVWDLTTGALRHTLVGHTGSVMALATAPDGSWLASGGPDGTVQIWDPTTGTRRQSLTGHTGWLLAMAVAPDGTWLASGGLDGWVRVWDPAGGTLRHILAAQNSPVLALAVAPDGSWLASGGHDGSLRVWDPTTGTLRHALAGHSSSVLVLAVAPDGSWLASAGRGHSVRIWDSVTGGLRQALTGHTGRVSALMTAPDGSWLASDGFDATVRVWNPAITGTLGRSSSGHTRSVMALVLAPDRSWLASSSYDRTVRIWDPAVGAVRHTLTDHTGWVGALVAAPDGSWLASGAHDGTVRIWDPVTGILQRTLTDGPSQVGALVTAPDGSWLASGAEDGTVRIWDPITGTLRHTLAGHTNAVLALVTAPDGSWLASDGFDDTVRIWDPVTGTLRRTLTDGPSQVGALVAAPDGSWLASGADDGTVRIWDPTTATVRHVLTNHTDGVSALVTAPDGSWLASSSYDRTVRIWDPTTGTLRQTLTGHRSPVMALMKAPDGSWLASAGRDGTIRICQTRDGGHLATTRIGGTPPVFPLTTDSRAIYCAGAHAVYGFDLLLTQGQGPNQASD
ncbi:NB-ARC domain-containing protein [Micromonospora zamorensis]|uniref:NB-ARC domain-containing protein n=1 Tax=Micromonospora zamorensis TaxID=709883 RepID=UPI00352B2CBC|nr:NB-ARC domain-containing protein [Micromonospora zamorensis]